LIIITNRIGTSWTLEADTSTPTPTTASYFESEKIYYDNDGAIRTAEAKGRAEGRAEGLAEGERKNILEVAKRMKAKGMSATDIAELTRLSEEDINALKA